MGSRILLLVADSLVGCFTQIEPLHRLSLEVCTLTQMGGKMSRSLRVEFYVWLQD